MSWWQLVLLALAACIVLGGLLGLGIFLHERRYRDRLVRRVRALPWRQRIQLARDLASDPRVPVLPRLLVPVLVGYLLLPIDLIPDFIPVIGQIDDLLVIGFALWLLVRLTPRALLIEHIEALEQRGTAVAPN